MDGVKHLYIENFHSIKRAEIKHIPADCQWVLLYGENGSGITHILQALHIGIAGIKNARHLIDGDWAKDLRILTHLRVKKENLIHDIQWNPQTKEWPTIECPSHFCSYGANRLEMRQRQYYFDNPLNSNESGLLNEKEQLLNIESWMKDQALQEKTDPGARERRTNVIALFMGIMPNITEIKLEGSQFFYREMGYKCSFFELDKGHQVIIATIGDMLIRLFNAQPQEKDPKNLEGIVIIDKLELHLSTTYQSKLLALLSHAFPKVQFICGTSSSLVVNSAPKNSMVFKVERDEWAGTTIHDIKRGSEEAVTLSATKTTGISFETQKEDSTKTDTSWNLEAISSSGFNIPDEWLEVS